MPDKRILLETINSILGLLKLVAQLCLGLDMLIPLRLKLLNLSFEGALVLVYRVSIPSAKEQYLVQLTFCALVVLCFA